MTNADFEDLRELSRCIQSDCDRYRLNKDTPLCAKHLREQEVSSPGIVEPDLEAKVARIRSEDDEHPGQRKVFHEDGSAEWVDDEDWVPSAMPLRDPGVVTHDLHTGPPSMTSEEFAGRQAVISPSLGPVEPVRDPEPRGCWVAYHSDWSGLALFADELEALRHAVSNSMSVGWAAWGQDLGGGRYPSSTAP